MLYAEQDAPHLKEWIVQRLADTSDADADVLADYVLALLSHEGSADEIRKVFEAEIPDFLSDDTTAFADDVFQAIKYKSYMPGAPPAPPMPRSAPPPSAPKPPAPSATKPTNDYQPQHPFAPSQAQSTPFGAPGSSYNPRKRPIPGQSDDNDVEIVLERPHKQPRRGDRGGFAFAQHQQNRPSSYNTAYQYNPYGQQQISHPQPPTFPPIPQEFPQIDAQTIADNIQMLQRMAEQMGLPRLSGNSGLPAYSGSNAAPRKRKGRCRDFDQKGFCTRGSECKYHHDTDPAFLSSGPSPATGSAAEYDPNSAAVLLGNLPQLPHPAKSSKGANKRESKKSKRKGGRPQTAHQGPVHDQTKTTIVVQNIPHENFDEEQIRGFFSQFGTILEVSLDQYQSLANIKYDSWNAANAAYSSPKVIFDNRFVKVFWYKDPAEDEHAPNDKNRTNQNGHGDQGDAEPEFDMDEFLRRQEEAQKAHEEKMQKRNELEQQKKELEQLQKELRIKQLEAKRKLQARLKDNGTPDSTTDGNVNPQTEALRLQLAALEEEATHLGLDPDAPSEEGSGFAPRGGWRGGRGFLPRGGYRGRGRGGYAARGGSGGGGVESRHAAYAAYSLDLRPKTISLSGVDFTSAEKGDALRQYLFSFGEAISMKHGQSSTEIYFPDRKTAEQFMFGVSASNTIPGLDDKVEATWNSAPSPLKNGDQGANGAVAARSGDTDDMVMASGIDDKADNAASDLEDGEVEEEPLSGEMPNVFNTPNLFRDQGDMDYDDGYDWANS